MPTPLRGPAPLQGLGTSAEPLRLSDAQVYKLADWHSLSHPERLAVIRKVTQAGAHDPRIANLAAQIIKQAGLEPRDYRGQAAALLAWTQQNIYFIYEAGERLQDPVYTIDQGYGDCDDSTIVFCALLGSVNIPWKLVICGRHREGGLVRFEEGDPQVPDGVIWAHIYAMVGLPPFNPTEWLYADTTIRGAPLGWDAPQGKHGLPELGQRDLLAGASAARYLLPDGVAGQIVTGVVVAVLTQLLVRWLERRQLV